MGTSRMVIVAGIMVLLAACSGEGNTGAGSSLSSISQGLSPGEFELEVDGYIRTQGVYAGGGEAAEFAPSNYGRSRERNDGSGGRQHVTATNADGPYRLRFNLDLQRRDEEPHDSSVTIQLPPDARAGETYPLETALRARHGEAILAINGYGQVLRFDGGGTVSVAELGEHISLQFEFEGGTPGSDYHRQARGRAYQIPLSPRGETQLQLVVDGQSEEMALFSRFRNDRSLMAAQTLSFDFPGDVVQPGTYSLAGRGGPGVASLHLENLPRDLDINGTIDLEQDGDRWSGTFQFEAEGEVSVLGEGRFDYVTARPAHL